jgi:hypothetical protein
MDERKSEKNQKKRTRENIGNTFRTKQIQIVRLNVWKKVSDKTKCKQTNQQQFVACK